MEKVKKELIRLIGDYLMSKTERFNFYGELQTKYDIDSIIDETIESICDLLEDSDSAIDNILENFDSTSARENFIRDLEIDRKYEEQKERELGLT